MAFHLYIFVIAHVFHLWDINEPFENIAYDGESRAAESLLLQIASESYRKPLEKESKIFFDFASAKRTIWNSIPETCSTCASRTSHPSESSLIDPFSSCRRANSLNLIERLQIEAYGEIKSSVMLTLPSKLPKELCLLIFEFAMASEEVAIDPTVFEPDGDGAGGPSSSRLNWTAKMKYRCLESISEE